MRSACCIPLFVFCALAIVPVRAQETPAAACGPSRGSVPNPLPTGMLLSDEEVAMLSSVSNQFWAGGRTSGPFPKNVVHVIFSRETPHAQVQAAVDRVCGEVIGGSGFGGILVRIQTDGRLELLWAAVDALQTLPHVELVGPDLVMLVPFSPFVSFDGGR